MYFRLLHLIGLPCAWSDRLAAWFFSTVSAWTRLGTTRAEVVGGEGREPRKPAQRSLRALARRKRRRQPNAAMATPSRPS